MNSTRLPPPVQAQRGAVLLVSLLMLIVLMLLSVSAINMNTVNLRIVDNMRSQMENDAAVQLAIDTVMSRPGAIRGLAASDTTGTVININDKDIIVSPRNCIGFRTELGNEKRIEGSGTNTSEITYWDFTASYTDPNTGATSIQHQGLETVLTSKNCLTAP